MLLVVSFSLPEGINKSTFIFLTLCMRLQLLMHIRVSGGVFDNDCTQWFFVIDIILIHTEGMERCTIVYVKRTR